MNFEARLRWVGRVGLAGFAALACGLVYLQVIRGPVYRSQAARNAYRLIPIPAPRGDIMDRQGHILATNRLSFDIAIVPQDAPAIEFDCPPFGLILDEPGDCPEQSRLACPVGPEHGEDAPCANLEGDPAKGIDAVGCPCEATAAWDSGSLAPHPAPRKIVRRFFSTSSGKLSTKSSDDLLGWVGGTLPASAAQPCGLLRSSRSDAPSADGAQEDRPATRLASAHPSPPAVRDEVSRRVALGGAPTPPAGTAAIVGRPRTAWGAQRQDPSANPTHPGGAPARPNAGGVIGLLSPAV